MLSTQYTLCSRIKINIANNLKMSISICSHALQVAYKYDNSETEQSLRKKQFYNMRNLEAEIVLNLAETILICVLSLRLQEIGLGIKHQLSCYSQGQR